MKVQGELLQLRTAASAARQGKELVMLLRVIRPYFVVIEVLITQVAGQPIAQLHNLTKLEATCGPTVRIPCSHQHLMSYVSAEG